METLPWLNKPGSRSIFSRLMGKAPAAAVERPPQQQYTSGQPFRQQVSQVMAPRTGPAQTTQVDYRRQNGQTVDVSRSGFVNPSQGDPPVANPFERRFPRPQTITAGSPMAQPLQQQSGLGRLFPRQQTSFRAPTSYNELPPIDPAMRQQARQWSGQPMAPNAQPPESPYGIPPVNYQRAPGAAMAAPSTQVAGLGRLMSRPPQGTGAYANAPQAPAAQPQMMPETNVTGNPIRQMLAPRPQDNPSDYNAFRQYNATGEQPNTTYSGSWGDQYDPMNKLPQANSREEILSRINMRGLGGTQTLQQAADDPNFNQDGRFFQGAKLGVNQNGGAYFREGPKPTDFAGNAQTAQEAGANRLRSLQALENRGTGYVDPSSGAFVGRDYQRFASDGSTQKGQIAGRLAAGGVTPSSLNQSQLDGNRLAMLTRMAGNREKAMARVQSLAQQSTAERRQRMAGPSPLDNLLRNNPQAALALQAQQQQQAGAERIAQLQNDGRMGVAQLEAGNNAQRNQVGGLAALIGAGMDPNDARAQLGLPALAGQQAGQGLAAAQNKPVFLGGKATQTQMTEAQELKKTGTPQQVSDYLQKIVGLTGAELDEGINEVYGSSFRTGEDPSWWGATGRMAQWATDPLFGTRREKGRGAPKK